MKSLKTNVLAVRKELAPGPQKLRVTEVIQVAPRLFSFLFEKSNGKDGSFSREFKIEDKGMESGPLILEFLFDWVAEVKAAYRGFECGDFSSVLGRELCINLEGKGKNVRIKAIHHESVARCTGTKSIENELEKRGKLPDSETIGRSKGFLESERILKDRLNRLKQRKKGV